MTISGPMIDISDLKPLEIIKASKAQEYIRILEKEIMSKDGSPVHLVHDGVTGTSDDFIADAWNCLQENKTIEGTVLLSLIERLISNGNTFRIWYANDDPKAYLNVIDCFTIDKILQVMSKQVLDTKEIKIRFLANK